MSASLKQTATITVLRNGSTAIHSFMSPPDGEMTCSQIIETENRLVIVDGQLLREYAQELRRYVDSLQKPIERVILSHPHVDHWLGFEFFRDAPIYALAEVKADVELSGEGYRSYKKQEMGDRVSDVAVLPTHVLDEGTEVIDGLTYVFSKTVNAESQAALVIELPEIKTLVAQDLVYNHVYPCVGVKDSAGNYMFDGWIKNLEAFQERGYDVVLAGHGEPTDASIFPELIAYIKAAKETFESGVTPEVMKATMIEKYPWYRDQQLLDFSNFYLYYWRW